MKKFLFLICTVLTSLASAGTSPQTDAASVSGEVRLSSVYIYSFLDVKEGELGRKFLAEVKRQLNDALAKEGVGAKQQWFNESPLANQYVLEAKGPNAANTNTRVPVEETIKASQDEEKRFGASHRLIVFPASVMQTTTFSSFSIRWTLIDSKTGHTVWFYTSHSHHTKWFLGDENPEGRAASLIEELIKELRKAKVIPGEKPDAPPQAE